MLKAVLLKVPRSKTTAAGVCWLPLLFERYFKPVMFVLPKFGKFANFVWFENTERPYHHTIVGSLIVCSFGPLSPRLFRMFVSIENMLSPRTDSFVFSKSTVSRFTQFANALCIAELFTTPFSSGL